jgi:hypothetical protein
MPRPAKAGRGISSFGLFMGDTLSALLAELCQFETILELLLVFRGVIIDLLALGTFQLDQVFL